MSGAAAAPNTQRPAGPVVRAAEIGLWAEAAGVLAAAQSHAEAVRAQGEAVLTQERQRGYEEGLRAAAAEVSRHLTRLSARHAARAAQIEDALPEVVCDVVEHVIGALPPAEALAQAIRHVLSQRRQEGRTELRVSPTEQAVAQAALAGEQTRGLVSVEADATMAAGACLLECELGSMELTLGAQLRALREGMAKGWAEAQAEARPGGPMEAAPGPAAAAAMLHGQSA